MSHAFAAQLAFVLPLRLGITTYISPRFDPIEFPKTIGFHGITDAAVAPKIITELLNRPKSMDPQLSSLRYVICAGAPMNPKVQQRFSRRLHYAANVVQAYGTTELGWISAFGHREHDSSGSVGYPLPGVCLKIVDENGQIVTGENEVGEACVCSPSMFSGYRGDPTLNLDTHDDEGFYRTGDRVRIENGKIFIHGRTKDIMKVNGFQVSPDELQTVIMELEAHGVLDCAVIGHEIVSKDGLDETQPRAFVVKKPDSSLTAEMISKHVTKNLARYKRLTGGVFFIDEIPRNPTGKILRRELEKLKVAGQRVITVVEETDDKDSEARDRMVTKLEILEMSSLTHFWKIAMIFVPLLVILGPIRFAILVVVLGLLGKLY
jgi:acyl-coenzyme A synthetase/AMP-(fatty) acid ligase